ncbi:MAG TPA: amidohydrolase family protein, partial [Candidatus Limnocylindrales bacterium]
RAETMAAEDVLHDRGVLSMYSSDSQAMGRIGESFIRLFQTAHKMRHFHGPLDGDDGNDNGRILRYLAKLTINPALTHGIGHVVGSLQTGRLADIVLWPIAFFGVKPKLIVKGGLIAWALMGDPNASIPSPEPVRYRPMFGALGGAVAETSVTFVSRAAAASGIRERLGLARRVEPVRGCRSVGKADMVRNAATPAITVDPETYEVRLDGELATVPPAETLPMTQLYFLV